MEIIYKSDFLSVKKFDNIEIDDFSILTGLNGSGKTHFLTAISNGSVIINGISVAEIKYYNYNDFTIKTEITKEAFKNTFKSQATVVLNYINEIKAKIINDVRKMEFSVLKLHLYNLWSSSSYNFINYLGNPRDYLALDKIKEIVNDRRDLAVYSTEFTSQFFSFLQNYLSTPETSLKDLSYEKIKSVNDEISKDLEEILKKYYSDLYFFLKQNSNGNIFPTSLNEIENANFNIHEIEDLQKEFELKKYGKLFQMFQDEKTIDLNKKSFESELGLPPIERINEVLNEYDCNGYYLTTNNFEFPFGVDREKVNIPIRLINKVTGLLTDFNLLSSGEKTLIALTFLIYKSRKGKIIPRVLLLDEIDSSLHPSMVRRLLDVIQKIFVEKNKIKVILATHSPSTVALAPDDSIYIVHKEGANKLTKDTKANALNILTEGFATLDQGLKLFDQISKKKICVFSEGNNINYLKKANEFFGNSDIEFMEGIEGRSGKEQLNSLFNLFSKFPHTTKVFFVWDCDVNTKHTIENNTYPFIFARNNDTKANKGIENLFSSKHFKEDFYDTKTIDYGGESKLFNKNKFEDYILKIGTKEDFVNFQPLFDFIKMHSFS